MFLTSFQQGNNELMSGSCHLDRSANVESGVEIWLFIYFLVLCCVKKKNNWEISSLVLSNLTINYIHIRGYLLIKPKHQTGNMKFFVWWTKSQNWAHLVLQCNTLNWNNRGEQKRGLALLLILSLLKTTNVEFAATIFLHFLKKLFRISICAMRLQNM